MTEAVTKRFPDAHQDVYSKTIVGFWVYLMTDCLIFATLFAAYAVLHKNTFGGPSTHDIFDLKTTFAETMMLLVSSFASGMGMLEAKKGNRNRIIPWFILSFILGLGFVATEFTEFRHLIQEGYSWEKSAFLSSFFSLVGTHGIHVSFGLLWMLILMGQLLLLGLNTTTFRRLVCFNMFWHFLDLVWIFIFTFVYLWGMA